jgi:hypothetical protein
LENELRNKFEELDDQGKTGLLMRLALQVSIFARDTYAVGSPGVENPESLREFNELLHKILGQMNKYSSCSSERYPDDIFLSIMLEKCQEVGCGEQVKKVIIEDLSNYPSRGKE